MDETKERLKELIDFFTGPFFSQLNPPLKTSTSLTEIDFFETCEKEYIEDVYPDEDTINSLNVSPVISKSDDQQVKSKKQILFSRQDMETIIKTLELCKKNMTHFTTSERLYLMPLMALSGHVLLTETRLISRINLSLVSEISVYILQFLLNEISVYQEEESNYKEFNPTFLQQLKDIHQLSYDSEEYYRYFLKYRLIKFISYMLLEDEAACIVTDSNLTNITENVEDTTNTKSFFNDLDLIALCQMLQMKPMPDSLRLHTSESNAGLDSSTATTLTSYQSSAKRMRLTTPGIPERNSKEEFFNRLLTPFILSSNILTSSNFDNISASTPTKATNSITATTTASISSATMPNAPSKPQLRSIQSSIPASPKSNIIANTKIQSDQQIRSYLISHNQMYFQYVGGATSILNLINQYTLLNPYVLHLLAIEEGANLRLLRLDANHFDLICDRIAADIDLVNSVFTLNRLLEPLTDDRISKIIVLVQACLNACLSLISHTNLNTPTKSLCMDSILPNRIEMAPMKIIEQSLLLYDKAFETLRQSNRVAGQIIQNAHMFTVWLLFSGLQMILNNKSSTSLVKSQQGYSSLCIPLAKHALKLMSYLLDDLHLVFGDQNNSLEDVDTDQQIQELNFFNKKFSFNLPSAATNQISQQSVTATPNPTPTTGLSPSSSRSSIVGSGTLSTSASSSVLTVQTSRGLNATLKYNKFGHYSAWQRIDMIVSSNLNVIQLLFSYLSVGYRHATLLRHSICKLPKEELIKVEKANENSGTETSKVLKYMEMFKLNQNDVARALDLNIRVLDLDDDDDDDDSDDYEDINPALLELVDRISAQTQTKKQNKESAKIALKCRLENEIDSHYELVIYILDHLNYYYVCSKIDALRSYFKQMLTDAQSIILAHVIQDLDSEMDNIQALSPLSSKTFYRFSSSLTSFMHNLIAMQILSEEQQNSLLAYLGFKPSIEPESSWPLYHGVRSLAILAQIILLRQQKEQEEIKPDLNSTALQIWHGFINKLKQSALSFKGETASYNSACHDFHEDVNVEHAQLMLFLFHHLKLLQRKYVFSLVGLAINEISVKLYGSNCFISPPQILFIGRLLHLLEYMCKNLYDTPGYLFEQINHNLLNSIMLREPESTPIHSKEDLSKVDCEELDKYLKLMRNIKFFPDEKLEEIFFKNLLNNYKIAPKVSNNNNNSRSAGDYKQNFFDFLIHPRFYHLMEISFPASVSKSTLLRNCKPKLDGIACNFMLAGFSPLTYDEFYSSLMNLFQFLGSQYEGDPKSYKQSEQIKHVAYPHFESFGLCAYDYTFQTMWRLVNQLPPSLQFFKDIENLIDSAMKDDDDEVEQKMISIDASRILNMCIWMPRFENNKTICTWISSIISKPNANANELMINELAQKFRSLPFNYQILKYACQQNFRYFHTTNNATNLCITNNWLISSQNQLLPFQYYQFPKFFNLFSMDIFLERIISIFNEEFKNLNKSNKSAKIINANENDDKILMKYAQLLICLFNRILNEIETLLIYDGPIEQAGTNETLDLNYLFYHAMFAISSLYDSFDDNLNDIGTNMSAKLPQSIISNIDQWKYVYISAYRDITEYELSYLFQKGALFEIPLIEIASNDTNNKNSQKQSSSSATATTPPIYYSHFSAIINRPFLDICSVKLNSIETGFGNITWIKLKQFLMKMYKLIEFLYSKIQIGFSIDPFHTCSLLQLNLLQNHYISSYQAYHARQEFQVLDLFFNPEKNECNELYYSIMYPYFIGNVYFILTVFKHPLFKHLNETEKLKLQKHFQVWSEEFFYFLPIIIKKNHVMKAFEKFFLQLEIDLPSPSSMSLTDKKTNCYLLNLIKVTSHPLSTTNYSVHIMKFFKTLLSQYEKFPNELSLALLCSELASAISMYDDRVDLLTKWFNSVLFNRTKSNELKNESESDITDTTTSTKYYIDDNSINKLYLFFKFICYVTKGTSFDEIALEAMAEALIQNCQILLTDTTIESNMVFLYFPVLFTSLVYLISAIGNCETINKNLKEPFGHFKLIQEVIKWLTLCKEYFLTQEKLKNIELSIGQVKKRFMIESSYQMISYLSDIFNAFEYHYIGLKNRKEQNNPILNEKKETNETKCKATTNGQITSQKSQVFIDDYDLENDVQENESENEIEDDNDEDLCNQLCTFVQTQKDYISQHWYHCHTCKMLEGVGVCTICAKVCHRNHDVTYSKYGSFFCDCGAKKDGSCEALVKRQPINKKENKNSNSKKSRNNQNKSHNINCNKLINDKKRSMRMSKYWYASFYSMDSQNSKLADNYKVSKNKFNGSNQVIAQNYERFGFKYDNLDEFADVLMSFIIPIQDTVVSLVEFFVPILDNYFQNYSELGYLSTIRKEFQSLQNRLTSLNVEKCEQIMISVKSMLDHTFENVQITNEQNQSTVRHLTLLTGAVVRRVSMLAIGGQTNPLSPCHLVVAHDKNRLSFLQLNHLLGLLYSNSKKKFSPQKIATVSLPFTIMNISHNPLNEELVAACGLKECHILSLARNGAITRHYSLSITFDNNNHIIKAFWFPDSQTELAIVSLDFIKIFDLSRDGDQRDQPIYNFLIPSRKIRDMTYFSSEENGKMKRFLLIFSSRGHIYAQELNAESQVNSTNDLIYVTQKLNVCYPEAWMPPCPRTFVGFSIHYSHMLQMLFFSYLNGCSFCANFNLQSIYTQQITNLTSLNIFSTSSATSPTTPTSFGNQAQDLCTSAPTSTSTAPLNSTSQTQPLFQWTEIPAHPGLIYALLMNSNNPVCFMVESSQIKVQELKLKRKVIDIVSVSTIPTVGNVCCDQSQYSKITTLISLCEDGSLRFHRAIHENTNFWLKPYLYNLDEMPTYSISKLSKSNTTTSTSEQASIGASGSTNQKKPRFAIDFFERCTLMNEIEYGGADVLEVYNTQQIKNRLNATNMYIACTKPNGFSITVTQTGAFEMVMAGIRVNLGVCDPARAPTAIEVFGRTVWVAINMQRWFDIPFTKSEMKKLAETGTFSIKFAPSGYSNHVTIVDNIRVYGRSRDSVGLGHEDENVPATAQSSTSAALSTSGQAEITSADLRRKVISGTPDSPTKSQFKKLRLLLFAPPITDDELINSLESKYQTVFIINRLLANSLDVLEALISFTKSACEINSEQQSLMPLATAARELINDSEYKLKCDTSLSIGSKLLTISLSGRLDKSICMLLAKLFTHRHQYDEHRAEIIFENAIENLKQRAYDDINVFGYNLSLFRETVNEHPRNFIRFVGKYFTQCNDIYASTIHFCNYLVELFWRLYSQRPLHEPLSTLTKMTQCSSLFKIVDSLVFILYSSCHAVLVNTTDSNHNDNQQKIIGRASQFIIQMLCSTDPQISFATKKALFKIFHSISGNASKHLDKQLKSSQSSKQNGTSVSKSSRERRHSGKHSILDSQQQQQQSSTRPTVSSAEPSTSTGNSDVTGNLRRQGATRRIRTSAPLSSPWSTSNRQDSSQPSGSSNRSRSSISRHATSLLERVQESLFDNSFDPYQNLLVNIDRDFPYFQNIITNLRREQDQEDIYESLGGEEEDEDDEDEDDEEEEDEDEEDEEDEELDVASISQPEGNSSSAPPPLFSVNNYGASDSNNEANVVEQQEPALDLVLEEARAFARELDEEDDRDEDEDEEDEFEAMDEDEMMEIAIALSLQEQERGTGSGEPRALEEIVDFGAAEDEVDTDREVAANDIIEDLRVQQLENVAEQVVSAEQQSQATIQQGSSEIPENSALHSESDEDEEELFEFKLGDATMESIEAEEEHDYDEDEDELNSMETSQNSQIGVGLKTSRSISKSNETISTKRSHHQSQNQASDGSEKLSNSKGHSKELHKSRKRSKKLVASKFCLALLKQMNNSFDLIVKLNGVQTIPFLQVLTFLADSNYSECDQKEFGIIFNQLFKKLLDFLIKSENDNDNENINKPSSPIHNNNNGNIKYSKKIPINFKDRIERKSENEVRLLIMRLYSIFLSNFKRFPIQTWQTHLSSKDLPALSEALRLIPVQVTSTSSKAVTFDTKPSSSLSQPSTSKLIPSNSPSNVATAATIHQSLLLAATQLIQNNANLMNYCFAILHHLLKNHWRQVYTIDSDDTVDKKKISVERKIEYNSTKSIKIPSSTNSNGFMPSDLRPFFTVLNESTSQSSSQASTNSTTTNQLLQSTPANQDTGINGAIVIVNNMTNNCSNPSNSSTTINSVVFSNHIFEHYPELMTELSLRITYQLKKMISLLNNQSVKNDNDNKNNLENGKSGPLEKDVNVCWIETLCEYMMLPSVTPYIRKQVRKLLFYICGTKDRYRQARDYFAIKTNLRFVRKIIVMHFFDSLNLKDLGITEDDLDDEEQLDEFIRIIIGTIIQNDDKTTLMSSDQHRMLSLPYAQLINLVDYLKACLDIASARVSNWQRLCRREVRIVPFLFRISFLFGEGISSIILQLLSLALFSENKNQSIPNQSKKSEESNQQQQSSQASSINNESSKSSKSDKSNNNNQTFICFHVFVLLDRQLLSHFIRFFLLESNSSQQRWATHSLLYMFFESLLPSQQEHFLSLFWQLWPNITSYGKRASQFVDLLGYFTLALSKNQNQNNINEITASTNASLRILPDNERLYAESAIGLLRHQNQVLIKHPNSNIYNSLQSLLDLNGYYLETESCFVCNAPEVNFIPVKLSSIKLDSRFTTNTQIVKLIGAHTISKISVKISELKKSKMVKTLSIYYNNRWVQSVVELKNKNTVWQKAKRITLLPSQSEAKIEFTLPIVACNLMIEYSNFYEAAHSSTEPLQCPRCSSVVLANPGVCTNCGENVFQCHKCRAINYDEKDPFLCNSCGFCKYAKFDFVLTARYTASAVEAIENEEDRTKAVQTINNLSEKADKLTRSILSLRPILENLLLASQDYHSSLYPNDSIDSASSSNGTNSVPGSVAQSTTAAMSSSSSTQNINRFILQLAARYSNECRTHFEELSKVVQKTLYTRKELVDYDNRQNDNKHNFEEIRRLLREYRQDLQKISAGSTASLSATSSSTLVDSFTAGIKKSNGKQALDEQHYLGIETKKKKLSIDDDTIRTNHRSTKCYGCAIATIEHCIILLKALVHNPRYKSILCSAALFRELIDFNLRMGTSSFRIKVRSLLCLLIRDDMETTEEFNNLLLHKIGTVLQSRYIISYDFGSIRHEVSLLAQSFENEDNCWEQRLRCVLKLFLLSLQNKSPAVLEAITLPCLRILYGLVVRPTTETAVAESSSSSNNKSDTGSITVPLTPAKQSATSPITLEQLASVKSTSMSGNQATSFTSTTKQIPFETLMVNVSVDLNQWLAADSKACFSAWQQRNLKSPLSHTSTDYISDPVKMAQFEEYLQRKYFSKWQYLYQAGRIRALKSDCFILRIASCTWIQEVLFNPTSKALRIACKQLLMALFERLNSKQRVLIDLFTSFLDNLCQIGGEIVLEFYDLYRSIVFSELSASTKVSNITKNCHWRYYLTLCGLLQHLGQLISTEIERLKQMEESSLSSDFSQGSALRQLVELMQLFMRDERIRRVHKSSMVAFVLDGYLSLRKLIVQRTKMIDETQTALLELLELLTTGTKSETINFMKICIESVKKCSLLDLRTPVFIFERLCSIIHPEEKDTDEFFISLEKDPQQEDFLQGRMLGNPYSSKDSGMGPLMRDIKNKICQECELVSLLEDDSGLELLVNNKIISLDLPVKEVYKKIVCADAHQQQSQSAVGGADAVAAFSNALAFGTGNMHLGSQIALFRALDGNMGLFMNSNSSQASNTVNTSSGPTMKIIYRIRGLMGDATEEFIETFSNKESIVKDDEKLFELANIMSQSSGLQVMLERLQAIQEINNRSRSLLFVLLKLFGYCVRVVSNRRALIKPELNAIGTMLCVTRLFAASPHSDLLTTPSAPGEPSYFEQLLSIMETLLAEGSKEEPEVFDHFSKEIRGTCEDIQSLMSLISSPNSAICTNNCQSLINKILRVVTFLSIGDSQKIATLIGNFRPYFEFDDYDSQNLQVENPEHWYELFCSMVSAIEPNHNGNRLKDRMIEEGFTSMAIDYLVRNAPPMKSVLLLNSDEWKDFTSKAALKFVLKMLTGMSRGHEPTQLLVTKDGVPIIHALEQVLSDSHMATLAENLMDALKENPSVEAKIQEIRLKTREEKKRIAMAVREKQLGELGMIANDKGQVMADSELLKKMDGELKEEKGLVCSICREGYAYQEKKVLAIYIFTKRCNVEEFETRKPRKTIGYTTVTHFNIVHVECHLDAVRHARTREEWQSASLHNANTRCNGLLPLWGPTISESLFVHALSRHNTYLQESVGQRDFTGTNLYLGTIHDLKLLLLRFANEKSFSEETGGGGAQSNLFLTPYLIHTALYLMITNKGTGREKTNFEENFMKQNSTKLIESCFSVDGPFFFSTIVLLLHSHEFWKQNRLYFLKRLILCSVIRSLPAESRNVEAIASTEPNYLTIKPSLMFFALINLFYTVMFKTVEVKEYWSQSLMDYIRHNDQSLLESANKMLDTFENDILMSASFDEFCDASDLTRGTNNIQNPNQFLKDTLKDI